MATVTYAQDVFALVQALTRSDVAREVIARAPDADAPMSAFVEVYSPSNALRPTIAVQQALQLSVDAAAIVADAAARDISDIELETVEALLRDQLVDLTVVSLYAGSYRGRWRIDPRTESGRRRILAIGGLAAIALHIAFPPLAPIVIAVEVVKELAELIRPDAPPPGYEPPASVDPADLDAADAHVELILGPDPEKAEIADDASPPPGHVYDIDIHGTSDANRAFVDRVRELDGVQQSSRAIIGDTYQRIRIWSSAPIDPGTFEAVAEETGSKILPAE